MGERRRRWERIANYCSAVVDAIATALIRRAAERPKVGNEIARSGLRPTAQARSETHKNNRRQAGRYEMPRSEITFE